MNSMEPVVRRRGRRGAVFAVVVLVAAGAAFAVTGCGAKNTNIEYYVCSMHPQVRSDKQGDCPICNMKLTPVYRKQDGSATNQESTGTNGSAGTPGELVVKIDPATVQKMGVKTAVVHRMDLARSIRSVGRIVWDDRRLVTVTPRYSGYIERLYVNETGALVGRGQALAEVYSPEVFSAQQELVAGLAQAEALKNSGLDFAATARRKLELLGVPADEIAEVEKTRTARRTTVIRAPASGNVMEKMVEQGGRVMMNSKLYTIVDLSRIWVWVDVYEAQVPWVGVGQMAVLTLSFAPGVRYLGAVTFVNPFLDEMTRTLKIRLEFDNAGGRIRPGMFGNVEIMGSPRPRALVVPASALIRSGKRTVAFVSLGGGSFEPREVVTGVQGEDDYVEVLSGLKEGEQVVTSGQFLIDSESSLREAAQKLLKGTRTDKEHMEKMPGHSH